MQRLAPWLAVFVVLSPVALSRPAHAHPAIGAPTAYPTVPTTVGTVVSSTFTITWLDYDRPIPTGTATIDWYYVTQNPKTYLIGATPEDLEGEAIVAGIAESDPSNVYTWDVSNVPSGSYFIWSKVTEPPEEMAVLQLYSFSQGVLTVHHSGDPVHPAVCFNKPDNPFTLVDETLELVLDSFDPDGTGRLRLELFSRDTPENLVTVFEDRASEPRFSYSLDTSVLEEGDYGLRLSIMDARGLGFSAYTRWFVRVTHRLSEPDGGLPDVSVDAGGTPPDAGTPTDLGRFQDAGTEPPEGEGCACVAQLTPRGEASGGVFGGLALLWLGFRLCRRRLSDAPAAPLG